MPDYARLLDSEIHAYIARCDALYPPDAINLDIAGQRRVYDAMCADFDRGRPEGVVVTDEPYAGVPCRRYEFAPSDATVIYYGGVTADKAQLETLQMPILGHFASQDPIVPVPTVMAFRDALAELNKDAQIFIYPHTKHAFSNPSGLAYQPVAAERAWQRTVDFFWENLQ